MSTMHIFYGKDIDSKFAGSLYGLYNISYRVNNSMYGINYKSVKDIGFAFPYDKIMSDDIVVFVGVIPNNENMFYNIMTNNIGVRYILFGNNKEYIKFIQEMKLYYKERDINSFKNVLYSVNTDLCLSYIVYNICMKQLVDANKTKMPASAPGIILMMQGYANNMDKPGINDFIYGFKSITNNIYDHNIFSIISKDPCGIFESHKFRNRSNIDSFVAKCISIGENISKYIEAKNKENSEKYFCHFKYKN